MRRHFAWSSFPLFPYQLEDLLKSARVFQTVHLFLVIGCCLAACSTLTERQGPEGDQGLVGLSILVNLSSEAPGVVCTTGGVKLESGLDTNRNAILDPEEVTSTEHNCNGVQGTAGLISLVTVTDEPAGANCATGGKRIASGVDVNQDNVLAGSEIAKISYICNGAIGPQGERGAPGPKSLLNLVDEPAGINCATGGKRVDTGIDLNDDSVLDGSEVTGISYVCHGPLGPQGSVGPQGATGPQGIGGPKSLINLVDEPLSANCPTGGKRVEAGPDLSNDDVLDPEEVTAVSYVCNGGPGPATVKYSAIQNASVNAVGQTFVNIPGASLSFNLEAGHSVELRAHGSIYGSGGTATYTHCGVRFVVDGVPSGSDSVWGDTALGCGKQSSGHPGWICPWYIEKDVSLDAGDHTVILQLTGWVSSDVGCRIDTASCQAAKLVAEIR